MAIHLEILNYVNKMLLDYINNKQEKLNHFREILRFFNVNLSLKGSQNFSPQATLTCPAIYILCMAILVGWVPDRLPSRRLFELVAATQCNFLIAARIRVKVRPLLVQNRQNSAAELRIVQPLHFLFDPFDLCSRTTDQLATMIAPCGENFAKPFKTPL